MPHIRLILADVGEIKSHICERRADVGHQPSFQSEIKKLK
jgi:hypothetical protein